MYGEGTGRRKNLVVKDLNRALWHTTPLRALAHRISMTGGAEVVSDKGEKTEKFLNLRFPFWTRTVLVLCFVCPDEQKRLVWGTRQMGVLRHDHVSNNKETILPANSFQDTEKQIAAARGAQQRQAAIATEGDEMQVAVTVIALGVGRHAEQSTPGMIPQTSKTGSSGAPPITWATRRCPPGAPKTEGNERAYL